MTMSVYRRSRQTPSQPQNIVPKQSQKQQQQQQREQQPIPTVSSHVYDEIEETDNQTNETYQLSDFTSAPDSSKPYEYLHEETPVYVYRANDNTAHLDEDTPVYVYRGNDSTEHLHEETDVRL